MSCFLFQADEFNIGCLDGQAVLKGAVEIDIYTHYRKLEHAEAREYKKCLKRRFKEKGKELEVYFHSKYGEDIVFQLNFLIESAFELELSFKEFVNMAHKAGYLFRAQTSYPPYFFLRYMLERKCWDLNIYRECLTDKDNIAVILEEQILSLKCFNEAIVKNYFQNNTGAYKMTFREALSDQRFQTDFICYFFEAVYVSGALGY